MKVFDLLFEAQNYEQMFSDLLKAKPDDQRSRDQIARDQVLRDQITENIQWARQNLKKNDRIVWYLRWVKMWLNNMVGLEAYNKRFGTQYTQADLHSIYQIRQNLTHFLGLPIPEIQNYVFKNESPQQIVQVFAQFEQQWRDAMAEEKTLLAPEEDDEILLEFPDGYAWWLLSRGACDAEAEAMGHCGNVPSVKSGDQILSLRRKVQRGNELRWYPVATFIVNDGWLGEMKGRNNDKPIEKYHPYIVALLKHDMIRGIKGGGYMPSHNFSMHDLDPQTREELLAEKPSLASFSDYYHKEGMTPRVQNMLIAAMEEKGLPQFDSYDPQKKQFVVETYRDLDHFPARHL